MGGQPDVVVIGGGVAGLTTAVVLAEAGARVGVWAREPAGRTTSAVAGALWEPYRIGPSDLVAGWARHTFDVLRDLAGRPDETGVRMATGVQASRTELTVPSWAADVPGLVRLGPADLPEGHVSGFRVTLPLLDMPRYLDYLTRRLRAAGGTLATRTVTSLAEAADAAPTVVNCAGLGARDLLPDPRLRPVRGQLVVVDNPGITEWFVQAAEDDPTAAYFFPQPFGLVLGGTAEEDAWDTAPDPATARAIIARCAAIDPRVAHAEVRAHRVGLRPVRDAVRLERDGRVVHNYGHGGAGVTVSWGCAAQAATLALAR